MNVVKTELGAQVMKDRSVTLTAQQRSALILVDGKRTLEDVVKMTAAVGVTAQDIETLAQLGLVVLSDAAPVTPANPGASVSSVASAPVAAKVSAALPTVATQTASAANTSAAPDIDLPTALNAAITLCSDLGFKGFGLNMALTGVDSIEKLQKLAPEIRKAAGDKKYAPLHALIFGTG